METFTIAPEAGKTYTSKKGYPCKSDRDIADVKLEVRSALHRLLLVRYMEQS